MLNKYIIGILSVIVFLLVINFAVPIDKNEVFKIIFPVISSALSIIAGFQIQKQRGKEETMKAHFETIKQSVIHPLLVILQNNISKLPDLDNIKNLQKIDESNLNLLCNDFLQNHYPEIEKIWLSTKKTIKEIQENRFKVEESVLNEIDKTIKTVNFIYPIKSLDKILNMKDMSRFKQALLQDLLDNRFKTELLSIDKPLNRLSYKETPEEGAIDVYGLTPPTISITIMSAEDETDTVINEVRDHLLQGIKNIEKYILGDYRNNFKKLDKEKLDFMMQLNVIIFTTRLNFYNKRCNYM